MKSKRTQGMNWISQHKRLAIYLRDGLACCYCGTSITDDAQLTLDHLKPYSKGGTNEATNLVTCCHKCNSSRGNRSVMGFVKSVAGYLNHGIKAGDIMRHVRNCSKRRIDVDAAREMVARQGSCFNVLNKLK